MSAPADPVKFADLHLHTRFSDGSFTPVELVREAQRKNFAAIALTDHDTLAGIPQALQAGAEFGVEIIAGVEITCRIDAQEMHLLGYFFGDDWKDKNLVAVLDHAAKVRDQRTQEFVVKLNELGMPVTFEDVVEAAVPGGAAEDSGRYKRKGTFGRPHVAMALVKRGFVGSVDEAFQRFLKRGRPAYVERYRMTAAEAIGHVKRAGGVAVFAHPGLNKADDRIRELVDQGLDGLEVWHTRHGTGQTKRYLEMTEELDILATGGSDCHGDARGEALIGSIRLPYERLEALKARASECAASPLRHSPERPELPEKRREDAPHSKK